ncbi:MAG: winged helix-turn-helix transcriptional regulator [Calditrichaeota bacterium]|nr:winged helix-turn-helix transcriptional regulator [Calditrichota bacterium]
MHHTTTETDGADLCAVKFTRPDVVERIRARLETPRLRLRISAMFKLLSDPARLKIITALEEGELCVCEIAAIVQLSQSSVSHHLRSLRELNLVRVRRQGKMVFYVLADVHISALVAIARDHARETLNTNV